jgi:hypothetical protein
MLHLYFAAFGAVAAANVIAVIAIAAMIKALEAVFGRDGCGHHLSRWLSAPPLGQHWRVWGVPHCFA